MKTYICEICGEVHLGSEKPMNCPFCGARIAFIKVASEAKPVVIVSEALGEVTKSNLEATLELELKATSIYSCMSEKAQSYEIKNMFKRLACVEWVHALSCYKLLGREFGALAPEACSDIDLENFKETFELEDRAAKLYGEFARTSTERHVKIFFTGLMQAETDHIELIEGYLK